MAVPTKHLTVDAVLNETSACDLEQNEKATRQLGRPFLSRENSSNGDQTVKTFWRNLMSRKRGVSSNISEINIFIFNELENRLINLRKLRHCETNCSIDPTKPLRFNELRR